MGVRLAAFNLPSIAKLTMTDELHLQELGERKIALFCCIPDSDKSLNEETGAIFLVNETSHFLYENCDGQSVESLCELLFDQCIDKDQLDKRTVYEGCTKALETLLKMELLTIK